MNSNLNSVRKNAANIARCTVVALAFVIPLSNAATSILGLLFLITCLISLDRTRIKVAVTHPVTIAIGVLLALYLLGTLHSIGTSQDIQQALRKMSRLLLIPFIFPLFSSEKWRTYGLLAFLSAVFISAMAALNTQMPVFKDNIFTSLFVASASFILCHYLIMYPRFKWLILTALAILLYYLYFVSIGRTGQVLFFILYGLFCWQTFAKNIKLQVVAVFILAILLSMSIMLPSTFIMRQKLAAQEVKTYIDDSSASISTSSLGSRLTFARNAFGLIREKPVFGWGTGGFAQAYRKQYPATVIDKTATVNPHNQYLLTGVELGVPGILTLIMLFGLIVVVLHRVKHPHAKIGVGIMFAVAFGCLANSWLLDFASMFFFVVLIGLLLGVSDQGTGIE